jgi:hypothetical protein
MPSLRKVSPTEHAENQRAAVMFCVVALTAVWIIFWLADGHKGGMWPWATVTTLTAIFVGFGIAAWRRSRTR